VTNDVIRWNNCIFMFLDKTTTPLLALRTRTFDIHAMLYRVHNQEQDAQPSFMCSLSLCFGQCGCVSVTVCLPTTPLWKTFPACCSPSPRCHYVGDPLPELPRLNSQKGTYTPRSLSSSLSNRLCHLLLGVLGNSAVTFSRGMYKYTPE
jgi:hypothetical protein